MDTSHFVWSQNPILYDFGSYQLHYYTLFFIFGIAAGMFIVRAEYMAQKLDEKVFLRLVFFSFLGIVFGARLGHCLFYEFGYYIQHPLQMFLPIRFTPGFEIIGFSGLASHGGGLGILLVIFIFSKKYRIDFLKLADMVALATPLAGMCIRIGNFFNSEIIGRQTDGFYAVVFKHVDSLPRHPAQLYEAAACLFIFIILIYFKKQGVYKKPGFLSGIFLILLFSTRFLIEFVKENQSPFENGLLLNMGQLLSIPYIIAGIYLLIRKEVKSN